MATAPTSRAATANKLAEVADAAPGSTTALGVEVGPGKVPLALGVPAVVGAADVNVGSEVPTEAVGAGVPTEVELPAATFSSPPVTPPWGAVDVDAFLASSMKASSVALPDCFALMEPTIPAWQWVPVVCEQ